MMLKSMRDATPKDELFGSDQQDFYQDMFDQQMAMQLSEGQGPGSVGHAGAPAHAGRRKGLGLPSCGIGPLAPSGAAADRNDFM